MTIARDLRGVRGRQQRDGRPGSRQERPQHIRIVERQRFSEKRHQRGSCRLMQAILDGFAQPIVVPCCSACTSARTRCRLKMASARGTSRGNAARALAVASPTTGVATTSCRSRGHDQRSAYGVAALDFDDRVEAAEQCRRRVVGVPFEPAVAAPSSSESSSGPVTRSNTLRPATDAAALLPSPAAIGISLVTSTVTRWSHACRCAARQCRMRAPRRCRRDTGGTLCATTSWFAPSSRTSTMRARRYNSTATPRVSKPPPRLATEPGTTISSPTAASARTVSAVLSDTKQKRYHANPRPSSIGRASGGSACQSASAFRPGPS